MTTLAPTLLKKLARDWQTLGGYKSAQLSGIVGDAQHEGSGYHISRQDCRAGDYSIVRPEDRTGNGPDNLAAAIDMTMSAGDMRLCTSRLVQAYGNTSDPRRKYINAFNGTTNNTSARRWDVYARVISSASSDHLWHVHLEIRRKFVESSTAMAAILSVLTGETVEQYLRKIKVPVASVTASSSTSSAAPAFPGTLRRNDKQSSPIEGVRLFQARMLARGWSSTGTADGYFGPKLESVVKRWQDYVGLTPDGVIGQTTWPTPWTRAWGKSSS